MLQIDFLEELLQVSKQNGIHTAVDTAGHVPFDYFERIIPYTDLFLYDVKHIDSEMHKLYTGVGNELILSNLSRLLESKIPVWVRIPVIPSVNDSEEQMKMIRCYLEEHGYPDKVELLPYHSLGEHKYASLGRECRSFDLPNGEKMDRLKEIFK